MFKHALCIAMTLVACVLCAGESEEERRIADRVDQLRREFAAVSAPEREGQEERTIRALVAIVDRESQAGGDNAIKHRALAELGRFPESRLGILTLIREIGFEPPKLSNQHPLDSYTAAMALSKMGPNARSLILKSLRIPLANSELHLRAHVLARMDVDGDDVRTSQEITTLRLRQELKARKLDPEPPGEKEKKAATIYNLQRMITILEKPGFLASDIPLE